MADCKDLKLVLKGRSRSSAEQRMSHKVWLEPDPPVPSHDAADHKGVSAVISCVHLAIHFLTRIDLSAKRASGKSPKE